MLLEPVSQVWSIVSRFFPIHTKTALQHLRLVSWAGEETSGFSAFLIYPKGSMATRHSVQAQPDTSTVMQALNAGLWRSLEDAERSSMRLTCKDLHAAVDMLIDHAVLRVPERDAQDVPSALDVAEFHSRLNLRRLTVYTPASPVPGGVAMQPAHSFCEAYAARTLDLTGGLRVKQCHVIAYEAASTTQMLVALMPSLQHVEAFAFQCNGHVSDDPDEHKAADATTWRALRQCAGLRSLVIYDEFGMYTDDIAITALCRLSQLRVLRMPYAYVTEQQLAHLADGLPHLECLGLAHVWVDARTTSRFAKLHTLTGPPTVMEEDVFVIPLDAPQPRWVPYSQKYDEEVTVVYPAALNAFPGLRYVHGCLLELGKAAILAGQASMMACLATKYEASAGTWSMTVELLPETVEALRAGLAPDSLAAVRHMLIVLGDGRTPCRSQQGWLADGMACLVAAAPNLESLALSFLIHCPLHEVVPGILSTIQQLACMESLWLDVDQLRGTRQHAFSLGVMLASGMFTASDATGSMAIRKCALRRLWITLESSEVFDCLRSMLQSLGTPVEVLRFCT